MGHLPVLCPIPGWSEDLGWSLESSHGKGWGCDALGSPNPVIIPRKGRMQGHAGAEHEWHGAGTGLPWCWGFTFPCVPCTPEGSWTPPALPFSPLTVHLLSLTLIFITAVSVHVLSQGLG